MISADSWPLVAWRFSTRVQPVQGIVSACSDIVVTALCWTPSVFVGLILSEALVESQWQAHPNNTILSIQLLPKHSCWLVSTEVWQPAIYVQ